MGDEPDLSSDEEDAGWNAEPMAFDEEAVHRSAAAAQGSSFLPFLSGGLIPRFCQVIPEER